MKGDVVGWITEVVKMNTDLNQIEAMTTNELEALYGTLSNEEFRIKVSLSVVSLELEARLKSRRRIPEFHSRAVEETTASGNTRITIEPPKNPRAWGKPVPDHLGNDPAHLDREDAPAPEGCDCVFCGGVFCAEPERKTRSDKGTTRETVRAIDRSSCCGAEGRRMNTETLDCAVCREVVE